MEVWAKSNGETLKEHTEKVKEKIRDLFEKVVAFYLPQDGLLKEVINDRNRKGEFLKLLELVATYHDMGKISPKFQISTVYNPEFRNFIDFPDVPHSFLSPAFFNKEKIKEFKSFADFLECDWRDLLKIVLSSIAFHHWRENYVEKFLNRWSLVDKALSELKKNKELLESLKEIDSEVVIEGEKLNSHYSKLLVPVDNLAFLVKELEQDLPRKQKGFFTLLKGFLHRADHFASSYLESEIEIEPLGSKELERRVKEDIKRRAKEKYNSKVTDKNIWQLEKVKGTESKNLFLKATTGVGKTEFALLWARGKKLIYVLPIRTAVNAMWKRLKNIFGDDKVGLLHSDALFYLEDIRDHSRDESISESFVSYNLAKNLSYPVIVATVDQFFTAGLKYPGYEKIYATLAYSYVVLDEIQLYDPRIAAIIIKTLEEVTKLGARFCIMSATIPGFYKNIMQERGIDFVEKKYFPKNLKKHRIKLENGIVDEKEGKLNEDVENKIEEFLNNGKKVLVILNTIKRAREVYEKLTEKFSNKKVLLIHSQFTMQDKKEKEEIFEGEHINYPDILVATQIAEVSLDIDYDVLFTELAPLDSLFQRMGRILRRYRGNYQYTEVVPNVFICGNVGDKKIENVSGVKTVYREDVLVKTYELLKDKNGKILGEKEKVDLVEKFYEDLGKGENGYLDEFKRMLDILDSLYSVDSRRRAQDIFRDIIQVSGIPQNKIDDFMERIVPKISEVASVIEEYYNFRMEWESRFLGTEDSSRREELRKELKKKIEEYKERRRKINYEVFKILSDSLVHIYPTKKVEKELLPEIRKAIKAGNSALFRWISQTFEGLYIFENVKYDKEKGAIFGEDM